MMFPRIRRRHRQIAIFAVMFAVIAGIAVAIRTKPVHYDFPLQREIEKRVEDIQNGTGSNESVDTFVRETDAPRPITEIRPVSSSSSASSPSGTQPLPPSILIQVPFFVQAPLGNWEMPYQEACEEASMIMVHHYLDGSDVTPEQADAEILDLVQWENTEFNYSADITMEEAKRIAEDYYHHTAQLFYDFSIDDMKKLLAEGHPIILPLAGREVGNPYYSGEGPWYHMLVVTGYDKTHFITNDVGTKRGHNYRYRYDVLYDAIHNWTGAKEDITQGRKVMMVLEK